MGRGRNGAKQRPRRSDLDAVERGVETSKILGVGCHDPAAVGSRAQRNRGVDDVARARGTAQLTRGASTLVVQSFDLDCSREEPSETTLAATVAPNLRHDAGRRYERNLPLDCSCDACDCSAIAPFERDQSAGVERQRLHQRDLRRRGPRSSRSMRRFSSGVSGPPDSSSISSSIFSRASSIVCCSSARLTYALKLGAAPARTAARARDSTSLGTDTAIFSVVTPFIILRSRRLSASLGGRPEEDSNPWPSA